MKHTRPISNDDTESVIITESGGRLRYYFMNTFVFIAASYLITKFNQNPTVIGVIIGILIFVVLPFSFVEYFFVEKDKFIVLYKSVFFFNF